MTTIEICCGSYEDCLAAYKGGAERVELNSALHLGGLTPSVGSLIKSKQDTNLKIITMVRPRSAGFCYSKEDIEVMLMDAKILLENGADGIAFGFLNNDGTIDITNTKKMIDVIRLYPNKEVVFHRAFDCTKDPYAAIETCIELGIDRILTSGLQAKAVDGIELIKDLMLKYGEKIEILAGSGINNT
ncbi:MAG: copper homeostasis protein CutC, partial [Longicatena sp.]